MTTAGSGTSVNVVNVMNASDMSTCSDSIYVFNQSVNSCKNDANAELCYMQKGTN